MNAHMAEGYRHYYHLIECIEGAIPFSPSDGNSTDIGWCILAHDDRALFSRFVNQTGFADYDNFMFVLARSSNIGTATFAWFLDTYKPNVNHVAQMGESVLWCCVNHEKMLAALQRGADIHIRCGKGKQVIRHYARYAAMSQVRLLLDYGASIATAEWGIRKWYAIHTMLAMREFEDNIGVINGYRRRVRSCRCAIDTLTLALRFRFSCPKDVRLLLARLIWSSRRAEEWITRK